MMSERQPVASRNSDVFPLVLQLEDRIESFFRTNAVDQSNLVLHSTGVNFAHQFYVLSLIGKTRLENLRSVTLISGSVIAAVVWFSKKTGALLWEREAVPDWERHFFDSHAISPMSSAYQVPYRLARGRPLLSSKKQREVIRSGIGDEFARRSLCGLPKNFRTLMYECSSEKLVVADAESDFRDLSLEDLAVASTAVPALFGGVAINGWTFLDPVFSPAVKDLKFHVEALRGPTLVSNMIIDRPHAHRDYFRPHRHRSGKLLMATEAMQFCFGVSNTEHIDALQVGLFDLSTAVD